MVWPPCLDIDNRMLYGVLPFISISDSGIADVGSPSPDICILLASAVMLFHREIDTASIHLHSDLDSAQVV